MVVAIRPNFRLSCAVVHAPQPRWRFLLEELGGPERLTASDAEPGVDGERLELLALIRGLEALSRPSHLTLITTSRCVHRGLLHGLDAWRTQGWMWESFGSLVPVKNADLWKRVDHALKFHQLDVRCIRVDAAHEPGSTAGKSRAVPSRPHFLRPPRREVAALAE